MPAPSVDLSSFGSGQNVQKLVQQLVQVESQKTQKWSRQNQEIEAKIKALQKLKDLTTKLENESKKIYFFFYFFWFEKKSIPPQKALLQVL